MLQTDFAKWNFAGSLPATLVFAADMPLLSGAMAFDFNRVIPDSRILMRQVWYTTPKLVHGLLHYDGPHQLFFVGYECGRCGEIFLVSDTVEDEAGLAGALRHGCTESTR